VFVLCLTVVERVVMGEDFGDLFDFLGGLDGFLPGALFECVNDVSFELGESRGESDVLFLGSDGRRLVKCLHVPRSGLGGDGPVLFPGVSNFIIVAAYSDEFIQDRVQELIEEFDSEEEREEEWEKFMSTLAKDIAYIYDQNPPENLVDQLGDL
jgi:hypothetical protein